jgi:hypothetical protein
MESNIIYEALATIVQRIKYAPENQPLDQMIDLQEVASKFRLSLPETLVVAFLATEDSDNNGLTRERLVGYLKPVTGFNTQRIFNMIRKLGKLNILERERFSDTVDLMLNEDYLDAIETGNWEKVEALSPYGLYPLMKYLKRQLGNSMGFLEHMGMPMSHNLAAEDLFKTNILRINEHLVCVKYAHKNFGHLTEPAIHVHLFFSILTQKVMEDQPLDIEEWMSGIGIARFEISEFMSKYIKSQNWAPMKQGLVEIVGHGRSSESFNIELTDRGVYELLVEFDETRKRNLTCAGRISVPYLCPTKIESQTLIFTNELNQQLLPLKKAMEPEVQVRIKEALGHKNNAITALFYGLPGTGKTELCYQLAKEFDLPIFQIDVAEIQSKWVGDSEKNARMVFADYRKLCRQSKKRAILLFNEADALFSRRVDAHSSVDQMNNALKNIFLEGMENLDGLLFATTNLSANLDAAFERRFLFKIKFEKTDLDTQSRVWQLYFPSLDLLECLQLAKAFNLSPGQISNVQRKQVIEQILYPEKGMFESIMEIAPFEKLDNNKGGKVGFG